MDKNVIKQIILNLYRISQNYTIFQAVYFSVWLRETERSAGYGAYTFKGVKRQLFVSAHTIDCFGLNN
jgi:hypothetical protein